MSLQCQPWPMWVNFWWSTRLDRQWCTSKLLSSEWMDCYIVLMIKVWEYLPWLEIWNLQCCFHLSHLGITELQLFESWQLGLEKFWNIDQVVEFKAQFYQVGQHPFLEPMERSKMVVALPNQIITQDETLQKGKIHTFEQLGHWEQVVASLYAQVPTQV